MDWQWAARYAQIRRRLKAARIRAGLSQGAVARGIGVSRPTITWIESGKQKPSLEMLWALCQVYEVDENEVIRERYSLLDREAEQGWPSLASDDSGKKT